MFKNNNKNSFHASASQNQSNGQKKRKKNYEAGGYFHVLGRGRHFTSQSGFAHFQRPGAVCYYRASQCVAAVFLLETKHKSST